MQGIKANDQFVKVIGTDKKSLNLLMCFDPKTVFKNVELMSLTYTTLVCSPAKRKIVV